ncbi:MAG: 50S ribosomal protein L16 [Candidatus Altiarchaeota archaeon]|nr:50S ribosomal protein L16 [Candidatus Altiarchaeota archaeon]
MGLRPAKCYRWNSPAYTRVAKNPQDSFVTGIPGSKITHYNTGNLKASFDTEVSIVAEGDIQVRNNALESARIAINQILENTLGANNYMLKVRVYPHHIIRENVMATGAGADRVQSGMRNAFGKPIGTAARVHKDQAVITVYINKSDERLTNAKKALRVGKMKLPGSMRISVRTHK